MRIRGWRLAQIGCPVSGSYINAKMIKIVVKNLIFYAQRNTHLTLLLSSQRSEASFRNSNAILGELIQEPGKKWTTSVHKARGYPDISWISWIPVTWFGLQVSFQIRDQKVWNHHLLRSSENTSVQALNTSNGTQSIHQEVCTDPEAETWYIKLITIIRVGFYLWLFSAD